MSVESFFLGDGHVFFSNCLSQYLVSLVRVRMTVFITSLYGSDTLWTNYGRLKAWVLFKFSSRIEWCTWCVDSCFRYGSAIGCIITEGDALEHDRYVLRTIQRVHFVLIAILNRTVCVLLAISHGTSFNLLQPRERWWCKTEEINQTLQWSNKGQSCLGFCRPTFWNP